MPDVSLPFSERIRDERPERRLAAVAEALKPGAERPRTEDVAPLVDDADESVRQLAVVLLGQMGAAAVPALVRALGQKQPTLIRAFAASGLAQAGSGASPAAEALGTCLASPEESLRIPAALALSRIGASALPVLRRALAAREGPTAVLAARSLGWMGRDASPAAEDLKRLSASSSGETRIAALAALAAVTGSAKDLGPLTAIVQGSDRALRKEAIDRIGELKDLGRGLAPVLRRCLEDSAAPVRASAALALARVGSREAETREALIRLRKDPDVQARFHAAIALAPFGDSVAQTLREMAGDSDAGVAAVAAAGLHAMKASATTPAQAPKG